MDLGLLNNPMPQLAAGTSPAPPALSPPASGAPATTPAAPPAITPAAPPVDMRELTDMRRARQLMFDNLLNAAKTMTPVSNKRHTLRLANPRYADDKEYMDRDRKQAILAGQTISRRLLGTWELVDNATGDVLDRRDMTVAKVPYLFDDGTFVFNGNEYPISYQSRLAPGIYHRRREDGELEAHVNVAGRGAGHRYLLDPAKGGVFYLSIGQAKIPLLTLAKSLGASDDELREAWGDDVLAANQQNNDTRSLNKMLAKFVRDVDPNMGMKERRELLAKTYRELEVDEDVTEATLGKRFKKLDKDVLLAATKKLLAINRGEAEPDDRDDLAYQRVVGVEDLFAERLSKDYQNLRRQLLHKASWAGNLKKITPGALTGQMEAVLTASGLAQAAEEINPLEVLDKVTRITRMGEGGIPSADAIPDESRSVHPSQTGFIDLLRTPESAKAGVDLYLSRAARKGADGRLYAPFEDRDGNVVYKSPRDVSKLTVAISGERNRRTKRIRALEGGRIRWRTRDEIDLYMPDNFEEAFSPLSNLIPLKSMSKGQRNAMGGRMLTQALPLVEPEAPLVQNGMGNDQRSFENEYGRYVGAVRAEQPGVVERVGDDEITVRYQDGTRKQLSLAYNSPYNRKTFLHNTPTVKPGQTFAAGDLLARSNFTDAQGNVALGRNLRVAYIPYGGLNYEDAVVISKSAAKRFTSEHMYGSSLDLDDKFKPGKRAYTGAFGSRFTKDQLELIDDDGVIKPGAIVEPGDPLILAVREREHAANKLVRRKSPGLEDKAVTWEHHDPGVVTDVTRTKNGIQVFVKSTAEARVGDKLSGLYGNKGVISAIIDDEQMPRDERGRPFELLLNEHGLISRGNDSQMAAAWLGKVAELTGKPFIIPDGWGEKKILQFVKEQLAAHGLRPTETLTDPETGRKIPRVATGNTYFLKLHHTAESKLQGRSTGGYTAEGTPAKGGEHGSKRVSLMDTRALHSHGALGVLQDIKYVRGQENPQWWLEYLQGGNPTHKKVPIVWEKYVSYLQGAGINVVPTGAGGRQLALMPMTDKAVEERAGDRELQSGETVHFDKGLRPIPGGLFDPKLTGGHGGRRWSYIRLAQPMPNPVMEEPIRHLLDLTQKDYREVLAGRKNLGERTGPEAIQHALASLNIDQELARAREAIKGTRRGERDKAVRRLAHLKDSQRLGIHPKDWLLTKVPVVPPLLRPVSLMQQSGTPMVSDPNYLYKELIEANNLLKDLSSQVDDVSDERLAVYDAFKAVTGLSEPTQPALRDKQVKGLLRHVLGSSPKMGMVQRKLLSTPVDTVGRAVITPDPSLDMDSVALPEDKAWEAYNRAVVRSLRRKGLPMTQAIKMVEDRTPEARKELLEEMQRTPVYIARPPVLHRFGVMAFWPRLTKDDVMKISPLVTKGFGADFDGDAMQFHVPVTERARKEAIELMLPSRNLISPSDFKSPMFAPSQEYLAGLFRATEQPAKKGPVRRFATWKDVMQAFYRGEIDLQDEIEVASRAA